MQLLLTILTDQIEVECTFQIDCYFCSALSEHFQMLPESDWHQVSFVQSCLPWQPHQFCSKKNYTTICDVEDASSPKIESKLEFLV